MFKSSFTELKIRPDDILTLSDPMYIPMYIQVVFKGSEIFFGALKWFISYWIIWSDAISIRKIYLKVDKFRIVGCFRQRV